jgi:hypothetical protein
MRGVLVGIHVAERPHLLDRTLESLRINVPDADIVLLPDAGLTSWRGAPPAATRMARLNGEEPGPAAAFNRLIGHSRHPLVVFLENGVAVGPNCLHYLRQGLDADPSHGLAGPSTNWCWNMQAAFPSDDGMTLTEVSAAAYRASRKYGRTWRNLGPEHCLADFCYAVRRSVIDAIGQADEAYGEGPCWELDYNVRAARAGFAGIWCGAAFVHRAPEGPVRRQREARLLEANKRIYQSKFCGALLRGERTTYREHCRGDACGRFAPPRLIEIRIPPDPEPATSPPLATCVVLTNGRPRFLERSIVYFNRQDYPNRELLILDSGPEDSGARFAGTDIRYHHLPERHSLGHIRNIGCELARGEIICQWDDDDWYGSSRLSRQTAPLLDGRAEITGFTAELFFDLARWQFWTCTPELHRRIFVGDVSGGTLAYWHWVWERLARYPDVSLAEDAGFLDAAMRKGARLSRIGRTGDPDFIYLRHAGNTWQFECGTFVDPDGWKLAPEPDFDAADRAFYAAIAEGAQ